MIEGDSLRQWTLLCRIVARTAPRDDFKLWLNCIGISGADAERVRKGIDLLNIFGVSYARMVIKSLDDPEVDWMVKGRHY